MVMERRKFQGVVNILSFNRHFYFAGLVILAVVLLVIYFAHWPSVVFWLVIAAFLYGLITPLIVSAYVYDFSDYYKLDWLKSLVGNHEKVKLIVNINAGFDETSFILKSK